MANKLTNLQISEISSVDRGAAGDREGRGRAAVLLLKRHDPNIERFEKAGLDRAQATLLADIVHRATRAVVKSDNERTKPMTATEFVKSDRLVAADVSRHIRKLVDAGMSFDAAASLLHRYQAAGGYQEFNKLSPKRRTDASHDSYEEREPSANTGYYTESASNEDDSVPWSQETNSGAKPVPHGEISLDAFNKEVEACMKEEGCSRAKAVELVGTRRHRAETAAKVKKGLWF